MPLVVFRECAVELRVNRTRPAHNHDTPPFLHMTSLCSLMLTELTPTEIRDLMSTQPDVLLIDVREPGEYAIARIDGARLIPMRTLPDQLATLPRDGAIVLYCHHGMRSETAGEFLVGQGFSNVAHMVGGIDRWSDDIDASVAKY
jgi:rhodanese-related sulfurtransferase